MKKDTLKNKKQNRFAALFVKFKSTMTLRTYRKPLLVTIILFVCLNAVVIFGAAGIALLVDPTFADGNYFKLVTHFASCIVTPHTFVKVSDAVFEHTGIVIMTFVVIALGMVLFSGTLIATITTAFRAYVNRKGEAKGKIYLHHHFVILNWNSKVPDLLLNLMAKNYRRTVIVLSDKRREFVQGELESLLTAAHRDSRRWRRLKLIVKRGDPLLGSDLENVSIAEADHVVVMAKEGPEFSNDPRISGKDLLSVKILLALGNFDLKPNCNVVVETESDETKKRLQRIIQNLGAGHQADVTAVSFSNKIGQILTQSLIEPRITSIYNELFSFNGYEFYSYEEDESVEDYLMSHTYGIPVVKGDRLTVFAREQRHLGKTRFRPIEWEEVEELPTFPAPISVDSDFFIIGSSRKIPTIQRNLNLARKGYASTFKDEYFATLDVDKLVAAIRKTDPARKKTILLLADDAELPDDIVTAIRLSDKRNLVLSEDAEASGSDANVFVNLISIRTQLAGYPTDNVHYAVELMDSKNETAVRNLRVDTVVRSRYMMALLLSRVALNREARTFYDRLLEVDSEEGGDYFDIKVERVGDMLDFAALAQAGRLEDGALTFEYACDLIQSFYVSFDKRFMLLGYMHAGRTVFLADRQDRRTTIALQEDDWFVFVKY